MLRTFFTVLSNSNFARRLTVRFGPARRIARRFIAGETLEDAFDVVRRLNREGLSASLNHLGEHVATREDAARAVETYMRMVERIHSEGLDASVSLKPTHLGLGFGGETLRENVGRIAGAAGARGITVAMDMENAPFVETTLSVFHALLEDHRNLRQALQAALFRTADDLSALIGRGASARIIKGAYREPSHLAWTKKRDVDASFERLVEAGFGEEARKSGFYPALGTHDHVLIEKAKRAAAERGMGKDRFEFQMLLGVRRDWQRRLVSQGYRVRIYVPFGAQWYPYFMRRLAERPANAAFMARAILGK